MLRQVLSSRRRRAEPWKLYGRGNAESEHWKARVPSGMLTNGTGEALNTHGRARGSSALQPPRHPVTAGRKSRWGQAPSRQGERRSGERARTACGRSSSRSWPGGGCIPEPDTVRLVSTLENRLSKAAVAQPACSEARRAPSILLRAARGAAVAKGARSRARAHPRLISHCYMPPPPPRRRRDRA